MCLLLQAVCGDIDDAFYALFPNSTSLSSSPAEREAFHRTLLASLFPLMFEADSNKASTAQNITSTSCVLEGDVLSALYPFQNELLFSSLNATHHKSILDKAGDLVRKKETETEKKEGKEEVKGGEDKKKTANTQIVDQKLLFEVRS